MGLGLRSVISVFECFRGSESVAPPVFSRGRRGSRYRRDHRVEREVLRGDRVVEPDEREGVFTGDEPRRRNDERLVLRRCVLRGRRRLVIDRMTASPSHVNAVNLVTVEVRGVSVVEHDLESQSDDSIDTFLVDRERTAQKERRILALHVVETRAVICTAEPDARRAALPARIIELASVPIGGRRRESLAIAPNAVLLDDDASLEIVALDERSCGDRALTLDDGSRHRELERAREHLILRKSVERCACRREVTRLRGLFERVTLTCARIEADDRQDEHDHETARQILRRSGAARIHHLAPPSLRTGSTTSFAFVPTAGRNFATSRLRKVSAFIVRFD